MEPEVEREWRELPCRRRRPGDRRERPWRVEWLRRVRSGEGLPSSASEEGDCSSWPSREWELEASSSADKGERARRLSYSRFPKCSFVTR